MKRDPVIRSMLAAALSLWLVMGLAFAAPAFAQAVPVRDFAGEYAMQGKGYGAGDTPYGGTCSIQREEPAYRVSCFNRDTRHTYAGKGLGAGDTLSIFIGDFLRGDHNAAYFGEYLVVYRRRTDGVLDGTWVHAGSDAAGTETLTPVR